MRRQKPRNSSEPIGTMTRWIRIDETASPYTAGIGTSLARAFAMFSQTSRSFSNSYPRAIREKSIRSSAERCTAV
jgi:hypothetical protein